MNYEVKLKGSPQDDGTISLEKLAELSSILLDIARDAMQIRVNGFSKSRGKRPSQVIEGVRIDLVGLKEGSTILELSAPLIIQQLSGVQMDLDHPEWDQLYGQESGMSLVIKSFQQALSKKHDSFLDKPLLKDMKRLRKVLGSENETVTISNGNPETTITLNQLDFERIKVLEEQTPDPQKVAVVGKLDLLEHSRSRVKVIMKEGHATGFLTDELREGGVEQYWGKELALIGTGYFRPDGKLSYIHIDQISSPGDSDDIFRRLPKSESVEQQIQRQLREGKKSNPLGEIRGAWPGDESLEELLDLIRK